MKPYGNNHVQFGEGKYPSTKGFPPGPFKKKIRKSGSKVRRHQDKLNLNREHITD